MTETTVNISGMMCGMCESHINDAIRNSFDVKKVNSSHTKGETVIVSKEALDEDKIKSVIDKTGYELKSISSEEFEEKKGLFGFLKK